MSTMARASSREGESVSAPVVWMAWSSFEGGGAGDALGEDADGGLVLQCGLVAGGGVAADDVVVEDGLELPALGLGEAGEVGGCR